MKKFLSVFTTLCMLISMVALSASAKTTADHTIILSTVKNNDGSYTSSAKLDGVSVTEYDYTWHADPSTKHKDVKNSPAEYYTGTEPGDESVYIAHDITYYPELDSSLFKKVQYDDDTEWAYYYTAEDYTDFIFATLPVLGNSVPTSMMHSEEEAYSNAVLHITEAGTYSISGTWHGQIKIDLGDDAFDDENCKVTLILDGVDVTCTVAPAVNFYSVYECDNTWEDKESYSADVDTTNAGANVILADGKVNNISGANVFRMLKAKAKSDDEQSNNSKSVTLQKKLVKTDAAFYSYESMNIDGNGTLNITSTYEGLDTELHLSINGGNINIYSQDDGINVNEDKVSVLTFNGGTTHIFAGLGSEGDGIDSNGYLVVNGGTLVSMAKPQSDSGLDSDCGTYIHGGTVVALGSTMDGVSTDNSGKEQVSVNLRFSSMQNADEAIIFTDTDGNVVFAYDPNQDSIAKSNARTYQGAIVSSPELKQGETYNVYIGGDVKGTTDNGFFTSATATGFTDDAVIQSYKGTSQGGMMPGGFGGFGGGTTPPDMPSGDQPQGDAPQGNMPQDNEQQGNPPEKPSDDQQPQGDMPQGMGQGGITNVFENLFAKASTDFTLENTVNNFSNVGDSTGSAGGIFSNIFSWISNLFSMIRGLFANIINLFNK